MDEFIWKSAAMNFSGPHEIHVTTAQQATDVDRFREACGELGVKAHVIYNEMPSGKMVADYLTGSERTCTTAQALKELGRIASGLRDAGLEVVREKIETTPWHPAAPRLGHSVPRQSGTYFESHFTLPDLPTIHGHKSLQWHGSPFLISTTDNKRREGLLFATMRHYESTSEEFCSTIKKLHSALLEQLPYVKFPTIEFAVYDSNPDHDKEWVDSYQATESKTK